MKRTISLKLKPMPEQAKALADVQQAFNQACNQIVPYVMDHRCFNRVALHHLAYYPVRAVSQLGSQMVCNAIKNVADSYRSLCLKKTDDVPLITFKPTSSVHYDARTFSFKNETVSLYTLSGRIHVPVALGDFQTSYLTIGRIKEAELVREKRGWFLNLVLDLPDTPPINSGTVMGIDLGENVIAATSTGKILSGGLLRHQRDTFLAFRRRLRRNGSQSATQLLRKVSGHERRHVRHTNHEVSKAIVEEAVSYGASTIVLEKLTNIRNRIKARKRVRTRLHRWAWAELQHFITYKAEAAGLQVVYVNPAYSSQTCSVCGCLGSRKKHRFVCSSCGHATHADWNASLNLVAFTKSIGFVRGVVTRPNVAAVLS